MCIRDRLYTVTRSTSFGPTVYRRGSGGAGATCSAVKTRRVSTVLPSVVRCSFYGGATPSGLELVAHRRSNPRRLVVPVHGEVRRSRLPRSLDPHTRPEDVIPDSHAVAQDLSLIHIS